MSRSGDCGKRPRWPCEPLAGGSGPGHDRGDGPTSGHGSRRAATAGGTPPPDSTCLPPDRYSSAGHTRLLGRRHHHGHPRSTARLGGRWTVDCETASRGDQPCGGRDAKLKGLTDTWSGAGQPDIIAQWGKMRLVRYLARGPRRHPVPVLIVSPLLASPTSWTSPLGSAWLITWSSGAWSCSSWISGSRIAGTGCSASRTTLVWSTWP
jgi:hypothetical protein